MSIEISKQIYNNLFRVNQKENIQKKLRKCEESNGFVRIFSIRAKGEVPMEEVPIENYNTTYIDI